jgi:hypothetical protein
VSCVLTNSDGCANPATVTSNQIAMTVNTIDNGVSIEGNVLTAAQSGASYQWLDCNNGNAAIPNAVNQSYTATNGGNYAVFVSVPGCESTSACVNYSQVSIADYTSGDIKLYPNPNNGVFIIELGTGNISGSFDVKDVSGKLVYSGSIQNTDKVAVEMIAASGVYIATIMNQNGTTHHIKFVVE